MNILSVSESERQSNFCWMLAIEVITLSLRLGVKHKLVIIEPISNDFAFAFANAECVWILRIHLP